MFILSKLRIVPKSIKRSGSLYSPFSSTDQFPTGPGLGFLRLSRPYPILSSYKGSFCLRQLEHLCETLGYQISFDYRFTPFYLVFHGGNRCQHECKFGRKKVIINDMTN